MTRCLRIVTKNIQSKWCLNRLAKLVNVIRVFRVLTCSKMSWKRYLDIHENALDIALINQDYSWYAFRDFRYSIFDEGVKSLATVFATENFQQEDNKDDVYERKMKNLLLVALRVFPKLAFYLAADSWRLNELQQSSENLGETWENTRREFQKIQGIDEEDFDILADLHVASNKPYLR